MTPRRIRAALSVLSGVGVVVVVMAAWYLLTPGMILERMARSAAAGDADGVVAYMDVAALRLDARKRAARALARNVPQDDVVLDHRMVTEALAGKIIDRVFSAEGARAMASDPKTVAEAGEITYVIRRDGLNNFTARLSGPRHVDLLFTRRGLTWRMTGIANAPEENPVKIV